MCRFVVLLCAMMRSIGASAGGLFVVVVVVVSRFVHEGGLCLCRFEKCEV